MIYSKIAALKIEELKIKYLKYTALILILNKNINNQIMFQTKNDIIKYNENCVVLQISLKT